MGKAARWLRGLFRMKRPNPNPDLNPDPDPDKPVKDSRRNKWSFVKSYREKSNDVHSTTTTTTTATTTTASTSSCVGPTEGVDDASKHAIAVAEAGVVVNMLTSSGKCNGKSTMQVGYYCGDALRDVWAALVIQSCFRSYLARRALRALKGLVKLQALVRGHIMRKKTKETMLCMQAMLRAQARARSFRTCLPDSPYCSSKSSQNQHPGPQTPEKFELVHAKHAKLDQTPKIRRSGSRISWSNFADKGNSCSSNWSDPRMDEPPTWDHLRSPTDDERHDRILEVDPGKPLFNIRRRNLFESSHSGVLTSNHITHSYTTTTSKDSTHQTNPSPVSCQVVQSLNPLKFAQGIEDGSYCTAENSPRLHSAGSQRGPFTPANSDGSRSFLSGCSDCPSYMAYTESAKAKMRFHSAPKQRPVQYEKASSTKRHTVHGSGLTSKAYPGSGRLDRFGMPVRDSTVVYYSGYLN